MAGVFELAPVGGTLSVAAGRTPPAAEAFLSGVLVTALATPCSAPFLAAAVAYGIAGGAASAVVVFTALSLGLVWPLALVATAPGVRRWLPKPGAWMVTLRQALAFPLLATVVWLAWCSAGRPGRRGDGAARRAHPARLRPLGARPLRDARRVGRPTPRRPGVASPPAPARCARESPPSAHRGAVAAGRP
jgi:thiol:disulfide interchange protein DsbD